MRIKTQWTVVLCAPKDWRFVPKWAYQKKVWPRTFQFHWWFFYCHRVEVPA